jgi:hypothetical protein
MVFGTGRPFSRRVHDVLQLVLGWSGQAFYNFRIHGQEIGRRRHLRTHLLREFQLRRREKVLYTYDFLDLREWEMRVLDIEPGSAEAWRPLLGRLGRDATGRVRRSARVHANSGSAQALSAHGRTGAGRERLAVHGGSAAGPESIETCSRSCSINGWRGPYNGEECHLR